MWIYCDDGFLSVVKHRTNPTRLTVRARNRADLDGLWKYLAESGHDDATLTEVDGSGYPWRIDADTLAISGYINSRVLAIDYPNFRTVVGQRHGERRAHVYHNVWRETLALETVDYGHDSLPVFMQPKEIKYDPRRDA